MVHVLAKTDNASKGVDYNDGTQEPTILQDTLGVHPDNSGVEEAEYYKMARCQQ